MKQLIDNKNYKSIELKPCNNKILYLHLFDTFCTELRAMACATNLTGAI